MIEIREPTVEECTSNTLLLQDAEQVAYAIWYPSMGGYVGKAVAVIDKRAGSCVDVYVWHNGEFPFNEDNGNPVRLHHCDPSQFVDFGNKIEKLLTRFK